MEIRRSLKKIGRCDRLPGLGPVRAVALLKITGVTEENATIGTMCGRSGWTTRTAGDVERLRNGQIRVTVSRNNSGRFRRYGNCHTVVFPATFDATSLPGYTPNDQQTGFSRLLAPGKTLVSP